MKVFTERIYNEAARSGKGDHDRTEPVAEGPEEELHFVKVDFRMFIKEAGPIKAAKMPKVEEPESPLREVAGLDLKQFVPDEETEMTTDGNITSDSDLSLGKIDSIDIKEKAMLQDYTMQPAVASFIIPIEECKDFEPPVSKQKVIQLRNLNL